jgi:ankyrin repeat protein
MIFLKDKTKEMPYLGVYVANDEIIEKHTIPQSNNYGLIDRDLVLNPILKTYTNGCDKAINIAENQRFINLKSKDGSNTLLLSVKKRNYILSSSLKFFEKHNPKGSIAENNNNSRLSYNSLLIVLLEMGANINEPDNMGNTPLMSAIENEDIDTVKLLIKKGADISIRRIDGKDALTLAEEKNNVEIVNVIKSFKGE